MINITKSILIVKKNILLNGLNALFFSHFNINSKKNEIKLNETVKGNKFIRKSCLSVNNIFREFAVISIIEITFII